MGDYDRALSAYESALRHNAFSIVGLSQIANIYRSKEDFRKASEYFGRVVGIAPESGDVWGALGKIDCLFSLSPLLKLAHTFFYMSGHCYLMIDDLKKAYSSYQQALYYMPNPQVRSPPPSLNRESLSLSFFILASNFPIRTRAHV